MNQEANKNILRLKTTRASLLSPESEISRETQRTKELETMRPINIKFAVHSWESFVNFYVNYLND